MSEFSKGYGKGLGVTLGALSAVSIYKAMDLAGYMLKNWVLSKINADAQKVENSSESNVKTAE